MRPRGRVGGDRVVKEEFMISRSIRRLAIAGAMALVACLSMAVVAQAKPKTLVVCKHGCRYTTIQGAVNASGKNATINVKPGKYVEGVVVSGHNAKGPGGPAQNGIQGDSGDNLVLENMKAEHFAANGFYVNRCTNYLFKNLIAGFEH